jgi:septum formation protein
MLQAEAPRLVLASQSAARQALLAAAGLVFQTRAAKLDETAVKEAARAEGSTVEACSLLLAELKALRVSRSDPEALVIGADQILVCQGRWFDKPTDLAGAKEHLLALRGQTHALVTSVVCARNGEVVWRHCTRPSLRMRIFSEQFLAAYLAHEGEALLSSVGAYRLEALGIHLFDAVEGEQASILGLPMLALLGFLRQHGAISG